MWLRIGVLATGTLLALGAWLLRSPDSRSATGPNVILVLVDTLRADHLGSYGYARATSPNLDAFAAGAVIFVNPRSQASCTFPSVNSLLTSRYPHPFLEDAQGRLGIPEHIPSLLQILKQHGYETLAVSSSPVVRASPGRITGTADSEPAWNTSSTCRCGATLRS